jgi:cytochrome bd-type quinol oxidase subunit 1
MPTPGHSDIVFGGTAGESLMPFKQYMSWWFNGTTWELQFHRLFAAISFFGFLLAMISVLHYLDRQDKASKRYWDWVGSYGIGIGLFGLLMQPILGMLYMTAIMNNQPVAFSNIMMGPRAWEVLLMVGLLAALILACISYFIDRRERILLLEKYKGVRRIFTGSLIGAAIFGFILVQPAWLGATYRFAPGAWVNPLGTMSLKFISLFGLIAISGILVMIDTLILKNEKEAEWGALSGASRSSAMLAGMLGMWIVIVMGFVRESARSPWTIFDIIPVPGGQDYPTPIPLPQIFIVWAIILAMSLAIFWYASKVTSYHPEEAETI